MKHTTYPYGLVYQRGASLIVVMVVLLLGTLVVVGSTRVGWFNELLVGSESDYQRAFSAAEALIRDAERDIKGVQADNFTPCKVGAHYIGCRDFGAGHPFFPQEDTDLDLLNSRVTGAGSFKRCLQGICLPDTRMPDGLDELGEAAWNTPSALAAMAAVSATYGAYTGAAPAAAGNPLLSASPTRAWYWVEVFRYSDAGGIMNAAGNVPIPDQKHPFIYRITAYVQGIKGGTRVWLRSVFVPYPQNQNS